MSTSAVRLRSDHSGVLVASGGAMLRQLRRAGGWFGLAVLGIGTPSLANIAVGSGGQASYGMAIAVPPGIAGMSPNLSLAYTDGGINGPVGVGWSVQGISSITRCAASRVVDGSSAAVAFKGQDKLCLDGQRLIQTDSSGVPLAQQTDDASGVAGDASAYREFRTEKDTYARIRAYGFATAGAGGDGPAYFKVWTKSGQLYVYGLDPDGENSNGALIRRAKSVDGLDRSQVMVWAVRRIQDTFGNYMLFNYTQDSPNWGSGSSAGVYQGREWNIAEILYTGKQGSDGPRNKVVFDYESRPDDAAPAYDRAEAYQLDNKNVSTQRLISIRTFVNAPSGGAAPLLVRQYKLAYERGVQTGRSRLQRIQECAGASATKCLPPTVFTYKEAVAPQFLVNSAFGKAGSPLANLVLMDAVAGELGVLTGDFNGDGRTDILRWSTTAANNKLYLSEGGGKFTETSTNLTEQVLFKTDNCFSSLVADFNGDGLSDILRIAKVGCTPSGHTLFLSRGNGEFVSVAVLAEINLDQVETMRRTTPYVSCPAGEGSRSVRGAIRPSTVGPANADWFGPGATGGARAPLVTSTPAERDASRPVDPGECTRYYRVQGRRYYVLDVNGDGILDFVTTVAPPYSVSTMSGPSAIPTEEQLCAGAGSPAHVGPCTRVYLGSASGQFTAIATNLAQYSVYSHPPKSQRWANPYWRLPDQADIDGDGLQDILATYTGRWRSMGNGDFTPSPVLDSSQICGLPIDFNGDGRSDCLLAGGISSAQTLTLSLGAAASLPVAQFNLLNVGDNLYSQDDNGFQITGVLVEDFDGDGRQDILRWGPSSASDNGIYLSNGDGSFRARIGAGLNLIPRPLQSSDGRNSFVTGDFLGIGGLQLLHMTDGSGAYASAAEQSRGAVGTNAGRPMLEGPELPPNDPDNPLTKRNQLYVREGGSAPVDVLIAVRAPTGLVSTVGERVSLPNTGRYITERVRPAAIPAVGNIVDIQPPMYVITSVKQQTGVGDVITEYLYKGLKVERGGRGMLGFHETRQQSPAPEGSALTVATQYLQTYPYTGVAAVSSTYVGAVDLEGARLLSQTTNSYCDKTARDAGGSPVPPTAITAGGVAPTPCLSSAKVQRPYVYQTWEEGWDLNTPYAALPKVVTTSTYNDSGDPLTINVETTGTALGLSQTSTKLTTNSYQPDNTSQDYWILGRLSRASVLNTVANSLPSITTSAGNSPSATARVGTGPPPAPAPLPPAVLNAILQLLLDD